MAKKIQWQLIPVRAGDLKHNPDNPKKRDETGMRRLRKLVGKYGLVFSGIANKDLTIIDGHSRSELSNPDEQVQVFVPNRQLSPQEYKEMNAIYDLARAGEVDMQIMEEQFKEEFFEEWEIDRTSKTTAVEDDYEPPEEVKTDIVVGDLFELGNHRILCGDSRDPKSVSKLMNGKLIDLIEMDPPYNVDYESEDGRKIMNDKMSGKDFYTFLLKAFTNAFEHTKPGGAWYIWHADSEGTNFRNAVTDSGIMIKQCLVWVKNAFQMGMQDYHWKHEPCLYGWKPGAAHYFDNNRRETTVIEDKLDYKKMGKKELLDLVLKLTAETNPTSVLHHDRPIKNDLHPTMKPILLIAPLIENSSKKGEIVADFFVGSGSTMVACHQLNRKCYAMYHDPKYVWTTIDRMLQLDPSIKIKKNGKAWKHQ